MMGVFHRRIADEVADDVRRWVDEIVLPGRSVEGVAVCQSKARLELLTVGRFERLLPPNMHQSARGAGNDARGG